MEEKASGGSDQVTSLVLEIQSIEENLSALRGVEVPSIMTVMEIALRRYRDDRLLVLRSASRSWKGDKALTGDGAGPLERLWVVP